MIKKRFAAIAVLAMCAMWLEGCSIGGSSKNIDKAMKSIENSDYSSALTSLDKAEVAGENAELVWRAKGIANMGLFDYETAIIDFKKALSETSGFLTDLEYDTAQYLALAQFKNGDKEEALKTYNAILELKPDKAEVLFARGKTNLSLGNEDEAEEDFNLAVKKDSKNPDLYIDIYEALADAGNAEQGNDYLKKAMELTDLTDFQKGQLYYWRQEYDSAKNSFEEAQKTDNDPEVVLYLGKTYEALGDTSYAASLYENYLESNPGNTNICNQLGVCQMTNKNYKKALEAFEQGLEVKNSENEQSLRYNQIVAYEYLSDFKKAAVLMEAYLKDYPNDENAKREYVFLSTR